MATGSFHPMYIFNWCKIPELEFGRLAHRRDHCIRLISQTLVNNNSKYLKTITSQVFKSMTFCFFIKVMLKVYSFTVKSILKYHAAFPPQCWANTNQYTEAWRLETLALVRKLPYLSPFPLKSLYQHKVLWPFSFLLWMTWTYLPATPPQW